MPGLRKTRQEGAGRGTEDTEHPWQRCQKNCGDLASAKVPGGENEHPRVAGAQRADFQRAVPESLVLGQNDPPVLTDCLEPDAVFLVAGKMIVVNLDRDPRVDQLRSDWLYAKRPVDEEYGSIRRLRIGLLLRLLWSPTGSPALTPRQNPQPCNVHKWMKPECRFLLSRVGRRKWSDS